MSTARLASPFPLSLEDRERVFFNVKDILKPSCEGEYGPLGLLTPSGNYCSSRTCLQQSISEFSKGKDRQQGRRAGWAQSQLSALCQRSQSGNEAKIQKFPACANFDRANFAWWLIWQRTVVCNMEPRLVGRLVGIFEWPAVFFLTVCLAPAGGLILPPHIHPVICIWGGSSW